MVIVVNNLTNRRRVKEVLLNGDPVTNVCCVADDDPEKGYVVVYDRSTPQRTMKTIFGKVTIQFHAPAPSTQESSNDEGAQQARGDRDLSPR